MSATTAGWSRSLTTWSLGALFAALILGIYGYESESRFIAVVTRSIQPLGAVWLNALQMTVIPLVLTQIIAAVVGTGRATAVGSIGTRAVALFLVLLFTTGIAAAVLTPPIVGLYAVPADIVSSITASVVVPSAAQQVVEGASSGTWDWVAFLVPANVFAAAAEGQILPLMLAALLFALAVTRLPAEAREPLGRLFAALADAMFIMIRWILWGTPVGVFVLVSGVALETGGRMVGVFSAYVLVNVSIMLILTAVLYALAPFGRARIADFARAVAPAQLIGLSTRSSLAALPAQIEGGRRHLNYSAMTVGFTVPLCVTTLRLTTPMSAVVRAFFVAHIFGITLGAAQVVTFVIMLVLVSFSVLGVPRGGVQFRGLPAYLAIGLPVQGYILLEAVDDLIDFAQTLGNVTGHAAAATLLSRADRAQPAIPSAAPAAEPSEEPSAKVSAVAH